MGERVAEMVGERVRRHVCLHVRLDGDGGVSPWPLTTTVLLVYV